MTGLLSHAVQEGVRNKSILGASIAFGVIALVLALVLLAELDWLRVARPTLRPLLTIGPFVAPLAIAALLTILVRIAHIVG